jgi:hypothetical protein
MPEPEQLREEDDQPTLVGGTAAIRTPGSSSGSSSADGSSPSDAPTAIESGEAGSTFPPTDNRRSGPPETAAGTSHGSAPVLQPGSLLGQRYEILKLLGRGGMAAEACASRTHRRRENPPPAGFEDHQECSDRL